MRKMKSTVWIVLVFFLGCLVSVMPGEKVSAKKNYDGYYCCSMNGANGKRNNYSIKGKGNKLIVTGKFYNLNLKEAWKYPKKFKRKKFKISKKIKYEREIDGLSRFVNRKVFFKNCNKHASMGFEVKKGKIVHVYYSELEPQL